MNPFFPHSLDHVRASTAAISLISSINNSGYKGALAFEIDAQYTDVSKEFSAAGYLRELVKRAKKIMDPA